MGESIGVLFLARDGERARSGARRLEAIDDRIGVRTLTDVERALAVVEGRDREAAVDCLVTEYRLRDGDALAVLERVRARSRSLPVLLFPVEGSEDVASAAITRGVSGYVPHRPGEAACYDRLVECILDAVEAGERAPRPDTPRGVSGQPTEDDRPTGVTRSTDVDSAADGGNRTEDDPPSGDESDRLGEFPAAFLGGEWTPLAPSDHQDWFRHIVEHVEAVVWLIDPDDSQVYVNPAYETVYGQDRASLYADPASFFDAIHADDRERVRERIANWAVERDEIEYRVVHPERGVRWVRVRSFPIVEDGVTSSVVGITEDVTERREYVEELRVCQQVLESVNDRVYALDASGRFRMVNDPLASTLGYDSDELVGEHVSVILAGTADGGDEAGSAALTDPADGPVEVTLRTADGAHVPCEVDVATLAAESGTIASVGVVRDVSDRKRVEAALEHERDRLSVLFENMPDPAVHVRFEGGRPIVRAVNPAFEAVFGYSTADLEGESINDYIVPPDERERSVELDRRVLEGEQVQTELRRQTRDGLRHFLFRGVTIVDDDVVEGFGIYADVTEQQTRERQLQVLNRVLRHNLRNDMNVVIGYAELVRDDVDDPALGQALDAIVETGRSVASTSEKVRTIADALDARSLGGSCDAAKLVERTLDRYRDRENVTISTALPDSAPVEADERLEPALENVVENAIEHRTADRVRIDVQVHSPKEDVFEIAVHDDGPGIPEEERRVLEGGKEISQLEHGSGLGLWLVDWIVTRFGGEVRYDEDEGTTVRIRLPKADE